MASPRPRFHLPPEFLLPLRRTFHAKSRSLLRDRPSPPLPQPPPQDDFYALLLSHPTPPAKKTINPARAPKPRNPPSSTITSPSETKPSPPSQNQVSPTQPQITFSTPLAGPSARMRGLSRGEKGLGRPPEPDNCCMSGCVNCVWDAYREEVEEWAAARRKRDAKSSQGARDSGGLEGAVGDEDEPGGMGSFAGIDLGDEGGLFEGVPVGIREFMNTEKRLRERRDERMT